MRALPVGTTMLAPIGRCPSGRSTIASRTRRSIDEPKNSTMRRSMPPSMKPCVFAGDTTAFSARVNRSPAHTSISG